MPDVPSATTTTTLFNHPLPHTHLTPPTSFSPLFFNFLCVRVEYMMGSRGSKIVRTNRFRDPAGDLETDPSCLSAFYNWLWSARSATAMQSAAAKRSSVPFIPVFNGSSKDKSPRGIAEQRQYLEGMLAAKHQAEAELKAEVVRAKKAGRSIKEFGPRAMMVRKQIVGFEQDLAAISKSEMTKEGLEMAKMRTETMRVAQDSIKQSMAGMSLEQATKVAENYKQMVDTAIEITDEVGDVLHFDTNGADDMDMDDAEVLEILGLGDDSALDQFQATQAYTNSELECAQIEAEMDDGDDDDERVLLQTKQPVVMAQEHKAISSAKRPVPNVWSSKIPASAFPAIPNTTPRKSWSKTKTQVAGMIPQTM